MRGENGTGCIGERGGRNDIHARGIMKPRIKNNDVEISCFGLRDRAVEDRVDREKVDSSGNPFGGIGKYGRTNGASAHFYVNQTSRDRAEEPTLPVVVRVVGDMLRIPGRPLN